MSLISGGYAYDLAERMQLLPGIERPDIAFTELRIVGDRSQKVAGFGTTCFANLQVADSLPSSS